MPGQLRQRTVLTIASFFGALLLSVSASAQIDFDLPAQPLVRSLIAIANLGNLNLLYDPDLIDGLQAPALKANVSADEAITRLLRGTNLRMVSADGNTVRVVGSARAERPAAGTGLRNTPAPVHLAAIGGGADAIGIAQESDSSGVRGEGRTRTPDDLAQVIVSAQKRDERLQDVPVPVTAISASALTDKNLVHLQDYYTQVPGFIVTPVVNGNTSLTIRGITSGGLANPTVGITVDDVPFGAASLLVGGLLVPDLDPGDLVRVEVLRGPQGTLYGASSLGGLVKFVTIDPSMNGVSGTIQAGVSSVAHGDDPGYSVRGGVNLPVTDTLALRVSAFHRQDPGYIDDVFTGRDDVNRANASGGHASLLFKPTEDFSVKLGALYQEIKTDGSPAVDQTTVGYPQTNGLGDFQQTRVAGTGGEKDTAQSYSAIVKAKAGNVDLTSVTGFSGYSEYNSLDYTYLVSKVMQGLFGVSGANFLNHYNTKKVSEEVRANIPIGEKLEWLVGGFYTYERSHLTQNIAGANPFTGVIAGSWSLSDGNFKYKEYAALTDLTAHLTDRFDIQIGGRESHIEVPYDPFFETGPRFGKPVTVAANESKANAFTYLITPKYTFSEELMAYARFASGYRPGAPNTGAGVTLGVVPSSYSPDKTHTYEGGLKGDFFNHTFTIDTSIYYIDWKDIQLTLFSAQTAQSYTGNASAAKSEGVEFSTTWHILPGLTLSDWISYNDAALTKSFPSMSTIVGAPGSRLPTAARWSGNISMDDSFPITSELTGFAGGSFSYVGNRLGAFLAAGQKRAYFPSYSLLNLDAGLKFSSWTATLFANNVVDKRGVLNGGLGDFPPFGYSIILPRTVGLNVMKAF